MMCYNEDAKQVEYLFERDISLYGGIIPFLSCLILGFDKNANSAKSGMLGMSLVRFQLVWRQLEFAFLVRWLRLAHFLFLKERKNEHQENFYRVYPSSARLITGLSRCL